MANRKSLKTILKEMRAADPKIICVDFFNSQGEHWAAHILYTQEFRLDSEIGKKWLAHKSWKRLEVVEKKCDVGLGTYKRVEVEV